MTISSQNICISSSSSYLKRAASENNEMNGGRRRRNREEKKKSERHEQDSNSPLNPFYLSINNMSNKRRMEMELWKAA